MGVAVLSEFLYLCITNTGVTRSSVRRNHFSAEQRRLDSSPPPPRRPLPHTPLAGLLTAHPHGSAAGPYKPRQRRRAGLGWGRRAGKHPRHPAGLGAGRLLPEAPRPGRARQQPATEPRRVPGLGLTITVAMMESSASL